MIWFLFTLLIFTFLLNEISFRFGFKDLVYDVTTDKRYYEVDEDILLTPVIENRKILSVPFLQVEETFEKGIAPPHHQYSLLLFPYQRVRRTYALKGIRRGRHRIKPAILRAGDFLGFKDQYKVFEVDRSIVVYPEKRPLKEAIQPYGSLYGDISVKRWIVEDPLMIAGLREYTGTESQKYIHWPSSLRHDTLMVKQFDFTTDSTAVVLLNLESAKPYWKDADEPAMEEAIVIARSLLEAFAKEKVPYGFASNAYNFSSKLSKGHYYHPGTSPRSLEKYLQILGEMNYVIATSFEDTLKEMARLQGGYNVIVIVTPRIFDSYLRPIQELSRNVVKTVVVSVDERNLNRLGRHIATYKGV